MAPKRALTVGVLCGVIAGAINAWLLLRWLGFGFWYLAVVVPMFLMTMQAVGSTVAKILLGVQR